MREKIRKVLSEKDKYILMKNQKISTDSNGLHYLDENEAGRTDNKKR